MSFKLGVAEASKRNEEKIKGSTQGFSGGFRWKFFFCVGFFFFGCCWLVGFCSVGVVGFCCFLQFVGYFILVLFFHSIVFNKNPNCQKITELC